MDDERTVKVKLDWLITPILIWMIAVNLGLIANKLGRIADHMEQQCTKQEAK